MRSRLARAASLSLFIALLAASTASAAATGTLSGLQATTPNTFRATITGTANITYDCHDGDFRSCGWSPYAALTPTGTPCPARGTEVISSGSSTVTPAQSTASYTFDFSIDTTAPAKDTSMDVCLYESGSAADRLLGSSSVLVQDDGACNGIAPPAVTPADGAQVAANATGIDVRFVFSDTRIQAFEVDVTPPGGNGTYDTNRSAGNTYVGSPGNYTVKFRGSSRWYAFAGTYRLRLATIFYNDHYRDGSLVICQQDPKFSTTLTITGQPPTAAPGPSTPQPEPTAGSANPLAMTLLQAVGYSRQVVKLRRHRVPADLKRGCLRRSSIAFRCLLKWTDRTYRWRGFVDLRHYADAGDSQIYVSYRFIGNKTRRACTRRCSTGVIWTGGRSSRRPARRSGRWVPRSLGTGLRAG